MIAITNPALRKRTIRSLINARSKPIRSMRQWAEQELIIPTGPSAGDPFSTARQPVMGLLLNEFDSGRWVENYTTGPSQSGKTLSCFVIPTLYHLFELGEDVVCGVPDRNMAADKWQDDLKPNVMASPSLRRLLPLRGSGSEEGKVADSIEFRNDAKLKFMSKGGRDQAKAGFTARVVVVTELAGFSQSVETSVEAGPLDQLEARQRAWNYPDRSTYAEGTLTIPEQLPWSAREDSSRSRIVSPCPNCGAWIEPERKHLVGWQNADNVMQAEELAHWICPVCEDPINEEQRRESIADCQILHGDQTIDRKGNIQGELPPTRRLWFHWKSWHNLFVETGFVARDEWIAAQMPEDSADREKAERKLTQFVHGVCFVPSNIESTDLDYRAVATRRSSTPRGIVPEETKFLTLGVDLGKWHGYWFGMAFLPDKIRCFDFGSFEIPSDQMPVEQAIVAAMGDFYGVTETGWAVQGSSDLRVPDLVYIDAGYQTESVFEWVRSLGVHSPNSRYMPIIGRGTGQMQQRYAAPAKKSGRILQIGDGWHLSKVPKHRAYEITLNADQYKERIHEHLALEKTLPGSLDFFTATQRDLQQVARHLTNEKKVIEFEAGKGRVTKWLRIGQQHHLDAAAYARAAGSRLGWEPPVIRA